MTRRWDEELVKGQTELLHSGIRSGAMTRRLDEKGGGTLLVTGICLALVAVAAGVLAFVTWGLAAERAQSVADLAAVGAAQEVVAGGEGCAKAQQTVEESGAQLVDCAVFGQAPIITVEVSIQLPLHYRIPAMPAVITRRATAGTV